MYVIFSLFFFCFPTEAVTLQEEISSHGWNRRRVVKLVGARFSYACQLTKTRILRAFGADELCIYARFGALASNVARFIFVVFPFSFRCCI